MTAEAWRETAPSRRRPTVVAWAICGLTAASAAAFLTLAFTDSGSTGTFDGERAPSGGVAIASLEALVLVGFGGVGAFVASRRPRNPVGWILCAIPVSLGLADVAERLAWHAVLAHHGLTRFAELMFWVVDWAWVPTVVPAFIFIPLLFPSGAPLTRRWRIVGWIAAGGGTALLLGHLFAPGPLQDHPRVDNPVGAAGALGDAMKALATIGFALAAAAAIASAVSLAVRFRRSRGAERQQIKWVLAAAALLLISFMMSGALGGDVGWVLLLLGLLSVVLAVATAILRYRLYDIDVVINRALVYTALTATLAAAYLGGVLLLQLALRPLTSDSNLAIAGSTLAVAALFRPARRRIQEAVDRRFFRRRYDARHTLEAFGTRLRDQVDLDELAGELRGVVADTMQPAHVSLWLRSPEAGR